MITTVKLLLIVIICFVNSCFELSAKKIIINKIKLFVIIILN